MTLNAKVKYFIYTCILSLGLFYPFYLYPDLNFNNSNYCDTLGYEYLNFNLFSETIFENWYFNDRLSALLLPYVAYQLFPFPVSNYVVFFLQYLVILCSLKFAFYRKVSEISFLIILCLWSSSSIYLSSLSVDYTASKVDIFIFFSIGFMLRAMKANVNKKNFIYCGFFYLLALHANPKVILFSGYIPLVASFYKKLEVSVLSRVALFLTGGALSTLLLSLVSLGMGGKFFFFKDTLVNYDADLVADHSISFISTDFLSVEALSSNSMYLVAIFLLFSILLRIYFLNNLSIYKYLLVPFLLVFIYWSFGGSVFVYTSATWIFPILFLLISQLEFKMEGFLRFWVFLIICFFFSLFYNYEQVFFQYELFKSFGQIIIIFPMLLAFLVEAFYARQKIYYAILSLFMLWISIKPFGVYGFMLLEKNSFKKKEIQLNYHFWVNHYYQKYGKENLIFLLNESETNEKYDHEWGISVLYHGCLSGSTSTDESFSQVYRVKDLGYVKISKSYEGEIEKIVSDFEKKYKINLESINDIDNKNFFTYKVINSIF